MLRERRTKARADGANKTKRRQAGRARPTTKLLLIRHWGRQPRSRMNRRGKGTTRGEGGQVAIKSISERHFLLRMAKGSKKRRREAGEDGEEPPRRSERQRFHAPEGVSILAGGCHPSIGLRFHQQAWRYQPQATQDGTNKRDQGHRTDPTRTNRTEPEPTRRHRDQDQTNQDQTKRTGASKHEPLPS